MKVTLIAGIFLALGSAAARPPGPQVQAERSRAPRILLVVAHPDDEYDMAATVYRIAAELHGVADEIVITDGEAGYHYSSLAERYYGVSLTHESDAHVRLAQIRMEESRRAAKVLGLRHQWFLGEKNVPFTESPDTPLHGSWHAERIRQTLAKRLKEGRYDFLFVSLPEPGTHGEHKAATILALETVAQIPAESRPVVLGAAAGNTLDTRYQPASTESVAQTERAEPEFHFDRNTHFGYQGSLSYQIVVDWVIAEHKSQGLFQTKCLQDRFENFWIFGKEDSEATRKTATLFATVLPEHGVPGTSQTGEPAQQDSRN